MAAQDAAFLDTLVDAPVVSRGDVAELFHAAAGSATMEVSDPDRPIRADELAALIVAAAPVPPSLGYLVAPGPRYAIRLARDASLFPADPRRLAAGMPVDGATLLRLARPALVAGTLELPAALPSTSMPFRRSGPWLEWDLVQEGALRHGSGDDDEITFEAVTTFRSEVVTDGIVGFVLEMRLEADGPDGGDPSLLVPRGYLRLEGEPRPSRLTPSLQLGRQEVGPVTADGVVLSLLTPAATIELGTGYTGLVSADLTAISPAAGEEPVDRPIGGGEFAPERIVTRAALSLPEILDRQTPSVAVTAVTDPDAPGDSLLQGDVALAGPLGRRTFYDVAGSVQSVTGSSRAAWLSAGEVRWYPRSSVPQQVGLSTAFTGRSGSSNPDTAPAGYLPLNGESPFPDAAGEAPTHVVAGVEYTIRPTSPLRLVAGARIVADHGGELSARYIGTEGRLSAGFRPLRSVILELNGSIFQPEDPDEEPVGAASLELTIEL